MKANYAVRLTVNTVSGNSGIYFGNTNVIFGVSSHSKRNVGIGDVGSGNYLYRNCGVVYDPDTFDTPIDDRDVHVYAPHYDRSASNVLQSHVQSLAVESLNQNAGIFIGDTAITGMDSHEKDNKGTGTIFGNQNLFCRDVNIVFDEDNFDFALDDRDNKSGVFGAPMYPVRVNSWG